LLSCISSGIIAKIYQVAIEAFAGSFCCFITEWLVQTEEKIRGPFEADGGQRMRGGVKV
jgi:hypothetical protein